MLLRQRIVVVVALGFALLVLAWTINRVWFYEFDDGGWFAYSPNTGVVYPDDPVASAWREAGVYLAATALWAAGSYWLLRARNVSEP